MYIVVKMRANDDGAGHKAVLLSGPPGIGKTTTAQIVCKVTACFMFYDDLILRLRMWFKLVMCSVIRFRKQVPGCSYLGTRTRFATFK